MPATRVLHLTGSPTSAFHADLSRLYAADCLRELGPEADHDAVIAHVTPDGAWRFPADLGDAALAAAEPLPVGPAIEHLSGLGVQLMVPQMFCLAGMTAYRALFDVLGIPYVGNTPEAMAITADKAQARAVVAAAGVDVPRGELVRAGGRVTIDPPAVVKPVDADNSLGVVHVHDHAGYERAVADALQHSSAALVEEYVPLGREVRCGVVEQDGRLVGMPLEEYRVTGVRTAEDKIVRDDDGALRLVAKDPEHAWIVDLDDPVCEPVWALARACHEALGCRHYSLFDVRIDPDGRPWFLEASLYCSFARQSVLCTMAAATGRSPAELFRSIKEEIDAG